MRNSQQAICGILMITGLTVFSQADNRVLKSLDEKKGPFTGYFSSLLLGYKQTSDTVKDIFIGTGGPFNNATGQKNQGKLSAKSVAGGIAIGYGYELFSSYFGLEIGFDMHNLIDKLKINRGTNYDFTTHSLKLKRHYAFNACFKYGFVLGNAMPYFRLGAVFSQWDITSKYPSLANLRPLGIIHTHHRRKSELGYTVGAGVDFKQSQHIILGGYVNYTQFNTFKYKHPRLAKFKISPSELSAGLKVSYLF